MGTSGGSVETWLQVFGQGAGSNATVPLPQLAGSTRSGSDVFTQAESLLRQIRAEEDGMEPSPLTGIELLSSFQWRRKLHVWQAWQHFTITGRQQRQAEAVARQQRLNDIAITFHLMYRAHSALLAWHRAVRAARDTAKREREAVLERQADARKQHAAEQFQRLYAQHACFAAWRKEVDRERAAHELQAEHAIRQDRIQRFVQHTLARKAAAAAQPAAESHKPSGVPVDAEAACSGGPNGIQEPQLGAPCRQSPQPEQQSQDDSRRQLRHQRFEAIKAKREEARRQKEEAEIAAIEEMQRAERIRQLEAKKKRLQQEAARDLRRQLAARQAEMAALHYANELAVRWGLRPWQQLVAHRRQQTLQATQFAARCSLIRCIAAWIDYISEAREAAAEALCQAELRADQQRRRVLSWRAMWALQLAVQWRQLAERDAAAAWFRTCAGQALAAWRQYTVLQSNARLLAALQTEQAADHHARMAGQRAAFRGWAQALHAACEEAAALARREQARQKINGWLDEYRRNKRAVAAESGNEDGGGAGLVQDLLAESSWASALQEPADLEPGAATLSSPTSPLLAGFKGAGHRSFGTNMQRPEDTSVENMAKDGNMASPGYNAKPAGRRSFGWLGGAVLSDIRNSAQFNDID
ncbi:hypothetical protein WJX72_008945 [[Myrmecia] bisecta]|uniref:Sfi1 spindle body domain-containing protein n=1 Tax=[Myrmecia] bisecta TaxID=41462 RepID=A0AAW1QT25_9CHLO